MTSDSKITPPHSSRMLSVLYALMLLWVTQLTPTAQVCLATPSKEVRTTLKLAPFIPRETPFLFGRFNAWSEEDTRALWRFWKTNERARVTSWQTLLTRLDEAQSHELKALVDKLQIPEDRAGWREAGVYQLPEVALYGVGLIPSFAFTVDDRALFSRWVAAQLQGETYGFEARAHPSGQYWRRAFKRWTVILRLSALGAHAEGVLQLHLLPRSAEPVLLSELLSPVERPLTSEALQERLWVFDEGVRPTGWIDLHGLISALLGVAPPSLSRSAEAFSLPLPPQLTGVCAGELIALSATFPLISLGASPSQELVETLLHLHPEALTLLRGLELPQAPFPEPSPEDRPALTARLSLNPLGLEPLLLRLSKWTSAPWSCPMIKSLNRLALSPDGLARLPVLKLLGAGLRGLELYLKELPSERRAEVTGWAALRSVQPELIWGAIQSMGTRAPLWLQGLTLDPKGVPVSLSAAPSSWPHPALSSSTGGGLILSFDQASLEAGVHQQAHAYFKSQGDPLSPITSSHQTAAPLLTISYRSDTMDRVRALFTEFKSRAERAARGEGAQAPPVTAGSPAPKVNPEADKQKDTQGAKATHPEGSPHHRLYKQLTFVPHAKGLMVKVSALPGASK